MDIEKLKRILEGRMNMKEVAELVTFAINNNSFRDELYILTSHDDRRISVNALWCLTHLQKQLPEFFQQKQEILIDRLMVESDVSKKRMFLQILRDQEYYVETMRSDFLDFCLSKINSECEPYAIRAFSLYTAFRMCRHFPELTEELRAHLEMLSYQSISPGLKSARRQVEARLKRIKF